MRLHHLSLLLFLVLVGGFAAQAARAPESRLWAKGWDKPVDPVGDCKFKRDGDVLTIEVPGGEHHIGGNLSLGNCPRMLRTVQGNYLVQLRVSPLGKVGPSDLEAGLVLLLDDEEFIQVLLIPFKRRRSEKAGVYVGTLLSYERELKRGSLFYQNEAYLRLERAGDLVHISISENGKKWVEIRSEKIALPSRLKVGLFASSTSEAPFKARFDHFRLTVKKGH
jgi:regulation of enolase protein 1 (concanavalin A-like superfamily)